MAKVVTKLNGSDEAIEVFYPSISDMMNDIRWIEEQYKTREDVKNNEAAQAAFQPKEKWFNYFSWEEAKEALVKGNWEVGIEGLGAQYQKQCQGAVSGRKNFYDVAGYQASVPRYLQGLPTNMVNSKQVKRQAKVINVVKHIGFLADTTPEDIIENSAKALAIVNAIEKTGARCNLDIYSPVYESAWSMNKKTGIIRIRIKNASERMSIGSMAFPLANPDMLRRFIFALRAKNFFDGTWNMFKNVVGASIYERHINKKNLTLAGLKDFVFLNNFISSIEDELKEIKL